MAIDKVIYNNGIKGLLSHYEIDSLPSDYEIHKGNFHEMTTKVTGEKMLKKSSLLEKLFNFFNCLIFNSIRKIKQLKFKKL